MAQRTDSLPQVFQDFKRAMFRADVDGLRRTTTDDFVWELHWGADHDAPYGHVLEGPETMAAEFARRRDEWTEVTYDDVQERVAGDDLIVQTFVVSGVDGRGQRFRVAAVDLYPLREGRVAAKQTYWKDTTQGPAR